MNLLRPRRLRWGFDNAIRTLSFREAIRPDVLREWPSSLETLQLNEFYHDVATARLLCQLPCLKSLHLGDFLFGPSRTSCDSVVNFIKTILTEDHTRENLTWLTLRQRDRDTRRAFHQHVGVCIISAEPDTYRFKKPVTL